MKVSVIVMEFVLVVLGIVAVAIALYFVATAIFGPGEPPTPAGEALATPLPVDRLLTALDLRSATFPVTARGYRMADVDALLERMAEQLAGAEARTGEVIGDAADAPDTQLDEKRAGEQEHRPAHAADD